MTGININTNYNRQIVSPYFRASQNVSKPTETEEKQGLSTGAKWTIGLGLTALASYGIYAFTKGRVKAPKPTPPTGTNNSVADIKEMAINVFKEKREFYKGVSFLKDKNGRYTIKYTGKVVSECKDGSKVVMEYIDGVLQKSTKTAKDGTKVFEKKYSYFYDGIVPYLESVEMNGETILKPRIIELVFKDENFC